MVDLHQPFRHVMPSLSAEQLECLREDMRANGMAKSILVDEQQNILDGHHRYQLCAELGVQVRTEVLEGLGTDEEKRHRIIALNLNQRQLSPAERKALERKQKEAALQLLAEGRNQIEVARIVGRPRATVGDWARGCRTGTPTQPPNIPRHQPVRAKDNQHDVVPLPVEKPMTDAEQKAEALRLLEGGMSQGAVARQLGRPLSTIQSWHKNPKQPAGHDHLKVDDREILRLWNSGLGRKAIVAKTGRSPTTVSAALMRLGIGRGAKRAGNPIHRGVESADEHATVWGGYLDLSAKRRVTATAEQLRELSRGLKKLATVARSVAERLNKEADEREKP